MPAKDTVIAYNLQQNGTVRARIEAIVRDRLWNGTTDPQVPIPIDDLAWAVASSAAIRTAVKAALSSPEDPGVGRAVDAITDAQLLQAVTGAMTRLGLGVAPTPPAP